MNQLWFQSVRRGGGDQKFSIMLELPGLQNCKIVELLGVKFAKNAFFSKFSRCLWRRDQYLSIRSTLYINFNPTHQLFLWNFRIFLQKWQRRNLPRSSLLKTTLNSSNRLLKYVLKYPIFFRRIINWFQL